MFKKSFEIRLIPEVTNKPNKHTYFKSHVTQKHGNTFSHTGLQAYYIGLSSSTNCERNNGRILFLTTGQPNSIMALYKFRIIIIIIIIIITKLNLW